MQDTLERIWTTEPYCLTRVNAVYDTVTDVGTGPKKVCTLHVTGCDPAGRSMLPFCWMVPVMVTFPHALFSGKLIERLESVRIPFAVTSAASAGLSVGMTLPTAVTAPPLSLTLKSV